MRKMYRRLVKAAISCTTCFVKQLPIRWGDVWNGFQIAVQLSDGHSPIILQRVVAVRCRGGPHIDLCVQSLHDRCVNCGKSVVQGWWAARNDRNGNDGVGGQVLGS